MQGTGRNRHAMQPAAFCDVAQRRPSLCRIDLPLHRFQAPMNSSAPALRTGSVGLNQCAVPSLLRVKPARNDLRDGVACTFHSYVI
jgi:hypothetical protein